jgi:F-type H+-transporting ATPase subunit beta
LVGSIASTPTIVHLDSQILLSRERAACGLYPAMDPLASTSRLLDPARIGERHYRVAIRAKQAFERYRQLQEMIAMLSMQTLPAEASRRSIGPGG